MGNSRGLLPFEVTPSQCLTKGQAEVRPAGGPHDDSDSAGIMALLTRASPGPCLARISFSQRPAIPQRPTVQCPRYSEHDKRLPTCLELFSKVHTFLLAGVCPCVSRGHRQTQTPTYQRPKPNSAEDLRPPRIPTGVPSYSGLVMSFTQNKVPAWISSR